MATFFNYKNGAVTVDTFKHQGAVEADMSEIISAYSEKTDDVLAVNFDAWAKEEAAKLNLEEYDFKSRSEVESAVFTDCDFVEEVCSCLGLNVSEYDLRDIQHDLVSAYCSKI